VAFVLPTLEAFIQQYLPAQPVAVSEYQMRARTRFASMHPMTGDQAAATLREWSGKHN
jgi:hypothetical protein